MFENIGSGHRQTCGDEREDLKGYFRWAKKTRRKGLKDGGQECALVRYSVPFLKRTGKELQQMEQRTIKLMMMYQALKARNDIDKCMR